MQTLLPLHERVREGSIVEAQKNNDGAPVKLSEAARKEIMDYIESYISNMYKVQP